MTDEELFRVFTQSDSGNDTLLIQRAASSSNFLKLLLDGAISKDVATRYNSFRMLMHICEQAPELLFPRWDWMVALLRSSNGYHRSIAIQLIASLAAVDPEKRFDSIFDEYFQHVDDEKFMVARYLVQNAAKIALARPDLRERIFGKLRAVDFTRLTSENRDLLKADLLAFVTVAYPLQSEHPPVQQWVQQLNGSGLKARRTAAGLAQGLPVP